MSWDDADLERSPVPLWFQIAERLREAVERGEFGPGDALPSESALNRRFGISRTTARAALDHLEHDGLVSRRSGKGSIVLPPRVDQPLNLLASFAEDMKARGLVPSYRSQSVTSARVSSEVATALGIRPGSKAIAVDRLLLADGEPLAHSLAWLAPDVVAARKPPPAKVLEQTSLYQWIENEAGVRIALGEEYIEAATASPALSSLLEIAPGDPVLRARRLSRSIDGRPVEYVVTCYRADRYRFRIELVRP